MAANNLHSNQGISKIITNSGHAQRVPGHRQFISCTRCVLLSFILCLAIGWISPIPHEHMLIRLGRFGGDLAPWKCTHLHLASPKNSHSGTEDLMRGVIAVRLWASVSVYPCLCVRNRIYCAKCAKRQPIKNFQPSTAMPYIIKDILYLYFSCISS